MKMLLLILSLFITGNSLDKQIDNYLNKYLSDYEKFEYEVLSTPDGSSAVEVQDDGNLNMTKNMVYIPIKISSSKSVNVSSVISVKVKLYKKVLVALENIKTKTDLKESMFGTRMVEVTSLRGTPVDVNEDLNSLRNKSFLNRGSVLTSEEVEHLPILFSGDEVTAVKTFGTVTVTVQALAREDGCIGEKIKIKTVDNKQFIAKVISRYKVYIEE